MLSYRHAFHAGNHADVLKHLTQCVILESLIKKPKPFVYIDTHSGAGAYSLRSEEATKTEEFKSGIATLMAAKVNDPVLSSYQALVEPFYAANHYPGSPAVALEYLRENDKAILIERHNHEVDNLRETVHKLSKDAVCSSVAIHHRDGFEALVALTPPTPKRGLVLVDPSYELVSDYRAVSQSLKKANKRWATGIYAIWYPLLAGRANDKSLACDAMLQQLKSMAGEKWLDIRFQLEDPNTATGMYGSGMFVVNPPWQLDSQLEGSLQALCKLQAGSSYKVDQPKEA